MVATRRLDALTAAVFRRLDLPPGPWAVALSGGADSAALAFLASRLGPVRAIHVNHGLPASEAMEGAAREVADLLSLSLDVRSVTLDRFTENHARNARYEALTSGLVRTEWLLTGHTADDQAETVLGNLLRGAGLDGLAGIPSRRGRIARPMLAVSRSETRELASLAELPWTDDPSNSDLGLRRNQIRLQLIPHLEAHFNPALRRHLTAAALAISELETAAPDPGEAVAAGWRAPAGLLWAMGRVAAVRAVRPAVARLREGYGMDRGESERVWQVVAGAAIAAELAGGLRAERAGPWFQISRVS